ncbi:hypothetical protein B7P43_G13799 [Cryptotermes secundus]|uniref:Uncharacterized protein n=1 Tax=Cryptotermes secundus TaxID=105785 RepID=A0A2J7R9N8_9NEOP|nr:hypothetical protein B7P43_G13799 [Cryptotermes secundus]
MSRVPFPMRPLDYSIYLNLPAALWSWGRLNALTEMSTRNVLGGKGRPARKAGNLTGLENVGTSTSHNPMGPHGLLQG